MKVTNDMLINGCFDFDFHDTGTRFNFLDCTLVAELISLKGCPDVIEGNMVLTGCKNLTSLEYAPKEVRGKVLISGTQIGSFEGIGKDFLCDIRGQFMINAFPESHILGFLKIKNLTFVQMTKTTHPGSKAVNIINKYLQLGSSHRNLRKCKSELEEAGLPQYAKL